MPWTSSDAKRFTKKARPTGGGKDFSDQWSAVANAKLASGADEGDAVKTANGVIKAKKVPRTKSADIPKVSKVNKE